MTADGPGAIVRTVADLRDLPPGSILADRDGVAMQLGDDVNSGCLGEITTPGISRPLFDNELEARALPCIVLTVGIRKP